MRPGNHAGGPGSGRSAPDWPVFRTAFGEVRRAATMIEAGLAESRMRIEFEVDVLIGSA